MLATRHYGPGLACLAGAVQVTTAWTVLRGRLAEADILLACLDHLGYRCLRPDSYQSGSESLDEPVATGQSTGASGAGCSLFSWVLRPL